MDGDGFKSRGGIDPERSPDTPDPTKGSERLRLKVELNGDGQQDSQSSDGEEKIDFKKMLGDLKDLAQP